MPSLRGGTTKQSGLKWHKQRLNEKAELRLLQRIERGLLIENVGYRFAMKQNPPSQTPFTPPYPQHSLPPQKTKRVKKYTTESRDPSKNCGVLRTNYSAELYRARL